MYSLPLACYWVPFLNTVQQCSKKVDLRSEMHHSLASCTVEERYGIHCLGSLIGGLIFLNCEQY